jgi:mannose PTS system EIIA component
MIALLIVAHGNLGDSLIQCATFVLGKRPEALENLDLSACDDPADMLDAGAPNWPNSIRVKACWF